MDIRLSNDAYPKTSLHQGFPNDGNPNKRAVNIAVAGDQQDVRLIPTQLFEFFQSRW